MSEPAEGSVHNCAADCREREEMARADDVRKVKQRAQQRADNKTKLHRQSQPRRRGRAEVPLSCQRGHDCGTAEPERHAAQLSDREQRERSPA